MKISCKASIIVICCITLALAQAPDTLWTRTYGGTGYDNGCSILQASDSSYLILGYTQSFGINDDIYLIKAAQNGDTLWTRTYGGPYTADGYAIRPTNDGSYIIIGLTDMVDASYDCYLIKIDQNGDTLWTRTYGGMGTDEEGFAGGQTSDGGYIIAGVTCEYDVNGDVYLIKTDANGDTVWTKHYGGYGMEWGSAVQEIAGGGYIIAGITESYGAGYDDVYLIKTDQDGNTVWTRTYGTANTFDWGLSVEQLPDSGYVIAGWTMPYTGMNADVYLVRTDASGDSIWTRTYGGANDDYAQCVRITSDNKYIVTGFTYSYGAGECDVYLLKIDSAGDTIWTTVFGGASFDAGTSLAQTVDGGYAIAGFTDSYGVGGDFYVIKTGADTLGIAENGTKCSSVFDWEIFPNLVIKECNIRYVLAQNNRVAVTVYDITGRRVKEIINENQDAGTHTAKFMMNGLPQGVYFIKLDAQSFSATKKIILID